MNTLDCVDLPAIWASYLINGDGSGLDPADIDLADTEVENLSEMGIIIVDVSEDTFFGRYAGLGYDLATYTLTDRTEGLT